MDKSKNELLKDINQVVDDLLNDRAELTNFVKEYFLLEGQIEELKTKNEGLELRHEADLEKIRNLKSEIRKMKEKMSIFELAHDKNVVDTAKVYAENNRLKEYLQKTLKELDYAVHSNKLKEIRLEYAEKALWHVEEALGVKLNDEP